LRKNPCDPRDWTNKDIKENPQSDLLAQATQREDEAIGLQKGRDADDLERYKAA
jgi:hypothetical protein